MALSVGRYQTNNDETAVALFHERENGFSFEFDTNPFRAISLDVAAIIFNTKFGKYFSPFFFLFQSKPA